MEWGEGIYGAEAASNYYYDKSCSDLTPQEAVALASILPSPRKWSPYKETKFMNYRRGNILSRMRIAGYISSEIKEEEKLKMSDELPEEEDNNDTNEKVSNQGSPVISSPLIVAPTSQFLPETGEEKGENAVK